MIALRPFFTYFGGKWRAAPHYPKPAHGSIVEPFAGAAGYSLRHPDLAVTLNDLDPVVAGTWDFLIRAPEAEILALPLHDGTWQTVDDLNIPQEARWLIGWWLNKATTQPGKRLSKWGRDGASPGDFWGETIRTRIASQQRHIRHWKITNHTYADVPNGAHTWFIDPPYAEAGKRYRHGSNSINFPHLGAWCRERTGQVIVAENDGATWLPFRPFRDAQSTAGHRRTGISREVIWTNEEAA